MIRKVTNADEMASNLVELWWEKSSSPFFTVEEMLDIFARSIPIDVIDRVWVSIKKQSDEIKE